MCFVPVIMLNILRFKSSVFFGTHILLEKSLRVLQLLTYVSKLTQTDSNVILECIH